MMLYTVTCIATAGSREANKNRLRIRVFPGNLKRFNTYASCVPTRIAPASTQTSTIPELRNALPMFAVLNALIKLSSVHAAGNVITLVD